MPEKLSRIFCCFHISILENNDRVHFNLGMLAMDDRNTEEAEHWFRRAVHLKQDFRSALFNLALLLADDHRPLEAAPFLNQLVKHHPEHIKGLILLGDIYINNIKDLDAAENVSIVLSCNFLLYIFIRTNIITGAMKSSKADTFCDATTGCFL